ncbi:MAG: sigma-54 dependent transcriptional regulator [Desulfobacterales bacterium]|jgi:two-component system NtrC family response regulator
MESILVVDDERNYTAVLSAVLEEEGFETCTANSGAEALEILEKEEIDLIVSDMKMPVMDGLALLEQIKQREPQMPVIIMTAHGTVDKAVEAMQKGAYTFILKPFDNERLVMYARKAIELYRLVKDHQRLQFEVESQYSFDNIIGKSLPMQNVFKTISKVGPTSATVLIEGESGTGKELVAKSIHFNSPRRHKTIVTVNCAALAENLLESELFGHEKGAFTGAVARRKGRFELADGGTIFLDEIGELPPSLQVKLLRVLQEKTIERVGGTLSIPVDIRIIAATNRSLKKETEKGRFREDLFYRLNVVKIQLPALKQRPEDIHLLINHFLQKYSAERKAGEAITKVDPKVERLFYDYHWPGNVRELENIIERVMVLCPGPTVTVDDLPAEFRDHVHNALHLEGIPADAKLSETLAMVERQMIKRAMNMTGHVQTKAAEILGITKSGLNQKLKKLNLS